MKTIKINVTASAIKNARRANEKGIKLSEVCVMAMALNEHFSVTDAKAYNYDCKVGEVFYRYGKDANLLVQKFDAHGFISPCVVTIFED